MQLRYFGIRAQNLERSVEFYSKVLGLKEIGRGDMTKYDRGLWVLLEDLVTGQKLELNWYPKGSQFDTPYLPGEGLDHVGFAVRDVKEAYQRAVQAGAKPTEVTPEATDGWQAYVKDPDGNWVEFFEEEG